jgi:transcriptional pleiotropic repressor
MKEKTLLDRVRELSQLILKSEQDSLNIQAGLESMAALLNAASIIVETDGKRIGEAYPAAWPCERLRDESAARGDLPPSEKLSAADQAGEPQVNLAFDPRCCQPAAGGGDGCAHGDLYLATFPLLVAGEVAGFFLLIRCGEPLTHDDAILAEIGSTMLGLMLITAAEEQQQELDRNKALAAIAFESLSFSEVEAIEEIFRKIKDSESIIVASKIADELGITRSVIVNALRKFESAGIIESRSLGMKGTFIRIKNPQALAEIAGRSVKFKQDYA